MVPGGPAIGAVRPVDAVRREWPFRHAVAQILRLVHVTRPRLLAANHQDQVTAAYLDGH
jgi:hypothetical protein